VECPSRDKTSFVLEKVEDLTERRIVALLFLAAVLLAVLLMRWRSPQSLVYTTPTPKKEVPMLPDNIVEVIHGPAVMSVGSRDERLHPAHTFVVGAVVHPDKETVTFFVPESRSERLLSNLKHNGKVALAIGLLTHEAYQLKGEFLASRPGDEKDRAVQEIYRSKILSTMLQFGYPEQIVHPFILGFIYHPAVAITFRVEEFFLQTPGPEAGKKIG
jgi:hypothetical protein